MKIAQPIDSGWVWDDSGSGSDNDVAIWGLDCGSDEYHSLGFVATKGNSIKPKLENYRCVREEYLHIVWSSYNTGMLWTDSGSGADDEVGVFEVSENKEVYESFEDSTLVNYPAVVQAGLFWAHQHYEIYNEWFYELKYGPTVQCQFLNEHCDDVL